MFKNTLTPSFIGRAAGSMVALLLGALIVFGASKFMTPSHSAVCYPKGADHTAYCDSKGVIQGLSINDKGLVVVRLQSPFVTTEAAQHGFDIQRADAMMMTLDASPQKQEMMTQLRLAYQLRRPVTLHAHSAERGYLVLDHLWLR